MGLLGNLLKLLKTSEATFYFRTSEGKLRKARGTLNHEYIPKEDWPKGKKFRLPAPKVEEPYVIHRRYQPYYDLDLGEWRRFKALSLSRIESTRQIIKPKNIDDSEFDTI
jgi:hypothetical protein